MFPTKTIITLFVLISLFCVSTQGYCEWHMISGFAHIDEDIELTRLDTSDPDAPLHEQTQGTYGFWYDTSTFITVIDFEGNTGPISPFIWDDVEWIPGPMDK